jgi:hypothetical protein
MATACGGQRDLHATAGNSIATSHLGQAPCSPLPCKHRNVLSVGMLLFSIFYIII